MTYVITVNKQGEHIFATREYSYAEAITAYSHIAKAFIIADGYKVNIRTVYYCGKHDDNTSSTIKER